jgi:hypothetical protein
MTQLITPSDPQLSHMDSHLGLRLHAFSSIQMDAWNPKTEPKKPKPPVSKKTSRLNDRPDDSSDKDSADSSIGSTKSLALGTEHRSIKSGNGGRSHWALRT